MIVGSGQRRFTWSLLDRGAPPARPAASQRCPLVLLPNSCTPPARGSVASSWPLRAGQEKAGGSGRGHWPGSAAACCGSSRSWSGTGCWLGPRADAGRVFGRLLGCCASIRPALALCTDGLEIGTGYWSGDSQAAWVAGLGRRGSTQWSPQGTGGLLKPGLHSATQLRSARRNGPPTMMLPRHPRLRTGAALVSHWRSRWPMRRRTQLTVRGCSGGCG